ncbi:hypothetical protein JW998_00765 [candidate division KSB1 bacterium]|nr:hypothetical protein [candidate division KSB1 bacterium]
MRARFIIGIPRSFKKRDPQVEGFPCTGKGELRMLWQLRMKETAAQILVPFARPAFFPHCLVQKTPNRSAKIKEQFDDDASGSRCLTARVTTKAARQFQVLNSEVYYMFRQPNAASGSAAENRPASKLERHP